VKSSVGVGMMIENIGDREPNVSRVLEELPPIEFDLWIVVHRELRTAPRFKLVFDIMTQVLGD
jgi:hypothetical protein